MARGNWSSPHGLEPITEHKTEVISWLLITHNLTAQAIQAEDLGFTSSYKQNLIVSLTWQ